MESQSSNPYPHTLLIGSVVRAVTSIGTGERREVYAIITAIAPLQPEHLGAENQPSLSLLFLDDSPGSLGKLSGANWSAAFQRHSGVRHQSHDDVAANRVGVYWIDMLPPAGFAVDLPSTTAVVAEAPLLEQSPAQQAEAGKPTQADLDAVAAEEHAKQQTDGTTEERHQG